jgi:hypothetical protein
VSAATPQKQLSPGWLDDFEGGVRQVFEHLLAHGTVTEPEAASMLGGPRHVFEFRCAKRALPGARAVWHRREGNGFCRSTPASRKGLVPEQRVRELQAVAARQLELAENGEGTIKFLRGGYGCGKTFMARLAAARRAGRRASRPASWWCPTTTCASTASTTCTARS